jgi:hypothetical protein
MPPSTKLYRWGKLTPDRRVYVSWLEDDKPRQKWIREFWRCLEASSGGRPEFAPPMQTGDLEPGALLDALTDGTHRFTDVVGVLTWTYLTHNQDRRDGPHASGELARFFDLVRAKPDDGLRVYLAAIDPPMWHVWRIRHIVLGDPDGTCASWLTRLRESQFTWPSTPKAASRCAREVSEAVNLILDRCEEREGQDRAGESEVEDGTGRPGVLLRRAG